MFAIEQSLLSMATHPDIHFEAVSYLQQMSSLMAEKCEATASRLYAEEAISMFERSIKTFMKTNMLMYFAYADYEEVLIIFKNMNSFINYNKFLINPEIIFFFLNSFLIESC